jgi:hypothetical protein
MEDINDDLPTDGKRYYMSHSEYFYTDDFKNKLNERFPGHDFSIEMKLSQLVCASNIVNARKAVKYQLEKDEKYIVTKCRIDYLIVGE